MVRALALCILLLLFTVPAAKAQIFLEVVGQVQGPIQGDATFVGQENRIEVGAFNQGQSAFSIGPPGSTSLSRQRTSVTIQKDWDPSSIKLLRAQGESEILTTCTFRFLRIPPTAPEGSGAVERRMPMEEVYLTIELVNARIEAYSASGSPSNKASESLSLTFDGIRYTYASSGEMFYDDVYGPGPGTVLARQVPVLPGVSGNGFDFVLPEDSSAGIEITDSNGHWVTTVFEDDAARSDGVVRWDATDASGLAVPAGVYTATVRTADAEVTRRVVIGG